MSPNSKRRKVEPVSLTSALLDAMTFFYPFLSVNDATNLGMTSREIKTAVDAFRPSVSVLCEERVPTKIGYENLGEDGKITVYQVQHFRFRIRKEDRPLQLNVKLFNSIWEEQRNRHCGAYHPSHTKFDFRIFRGCHDAAFVYNYDWGHCRCNKYGCFYCAGFRIDGLEISEEKDGPFVIPPEFEDSAYLAMACFWACAKQIACFPDGTSYPSAEYFMHQLPKILHPYFPEDFDESAPSGGRMMKVEFGYRPARSLLEWNEKMPPEFDGIYEYDLDDLPWYGCDLWYDGDESWLRKFARWA